MRRLSLALFAAALIVGHACANTPATSIEIDLEEQTAYLIRDGHVVLSSPICSGRPGHLTETGSFKVIEKERYHFSSIYGRIEDSFGRTLLADADADMSVPRGCRFVPWAMNYFIRFNGAEGMHAGVIPGYPASHGCVRLPKQNAIAFFNAVDVGTPVTVFGRTPRVADSRATRLPQAPAKSWPNHQRAYYPPPWWVR
jgi:lipoprotein-anchoring transpeptidase ErfK/SrfK